MTRRNDKGKIIISKNAFKDIVDICVRRTKNAFPIKKDNSYITIIYSESILNIDIKINIKRDVDVNRLSEKIQKEIYEAIYAMTNIKCNNVNVAIQGFEN